MVGVGGWWHTWTVCLWGKASYSTHTHPHTRTLPSTATSTTPPSPIRVSELKLLTAVTGPAQAGDGGGEEGEGGGRCCCVGVLHLFGSLAEPSGLRSLMQPGWVNTPRSEIILRSEKLAAYRCKKKRNM